MQIEENNVFQDFEAPNEANKKAESNQSEEGIRNPRNGTFIVPPYKALVFDMSIISVEDVPAVSGL